MKDWDSELKKIDRRLESVSDDQLLTEPSAVQPGRQAAPVATRETTRSWPALLRLSLAVALGVGIMFWPYEARCGAGLAAYLGAVVAVVGAGIWSGIWTWRHRTARAHVLSLLLVLWGLVLGGTEILPRIGYAKPTVQHPAIWSCE